MAIISVTFHVVISSKWHFDTDKRHRALVKFGSEHLGGWRGDGHVLEVVEYVSYAFVVSILYFYYKLFLISKQNICEMR